MVASSISASNIPLTEANSPVALTVPANLKTLIRMVMRAFYGFELFLCMEMLLFYQCIKEEDLADLLRLDLKHVHQHLVNLKKEKFINERSIMETTSDGRQSKHSYFYINYKMMVNVIKYKLDKIRIQIESEEKQCTSRANFKCTNCQKTYSDLDTKDIFLTMTCLYCNAEVEEDISSLPNRSSRNLLAKFNTQMEIVFELLSRVEHIRLADDILRPEPVDITHVLERMMNTPNSSNPPVANPNVNKNVNAKSGLRIDQIGKWSGDKTRNTDLLGQTHIKINFDTPDANGANVKQKRELPSVLLQHQTTDDDWDLYNRDSQLLNSVKIAADETLMNTSSAANAAAGNLSTSMQKTAKSDLSAPQVSNAESVCKQPVETAANLELIIMQKLLIHEKKSSSSVCTENDSIVQTASPLTPSKKRDFEASNMTGHDLKSNRKLSELKLNASSFLNDDETSLLFSKKRKLNNGDIVSSNGSIDVTSKQGLSKLNNGYHNGNGGGNGGGYPPNNTNLYHQKSYSDGSDRDEQEDEESINSYYNENDEDLTMPRVTVQNKYYRLDRLNQSLINQMNDAEKEFYINICRQLYTEIYEI